MRSWSGLSLVGAVLLIASGLVLAPASASSVTSATISGGSGTVTSGGVVYARQGGALTLTVVTSSDTQCVDVSGALSAHQQSATAKSTWTFSFTAGTGDGSQGVTATASPGFNTQNKCNGQSRSLDTSYVLDNAGPVVTGAVSPTPTTSGWNRTSATVSWSAVDAGVGVQSGPTPATANVSVEGVSSLTSSATDRLGNRGSGSVTVRLDTTNPTITGAAVGTTGDNGWFTSPVTVTFTCNDALAGIASCLADGTTTDNRTVSNTGTVSGTATDNAGNTAAASMPVKVDTTGPAVSGAPTTQPNGNGWYRDDVTVHWTANDTESGVPTAPADTTITGEGTGLTSSTTVKNGAGSTTTATSAPAVSIDRTPPTTSLSGAPSNAWTNGSVTLSLTSSDNLSGVDGTFFTVDGGGSSAGTSIPLSTEGDHVVTFWSVDQAGNTEGAHTVHVRIDKTAPTVEHSFTPAGYHDGDWTNAPVTVTFTCTDQGGSGVASCTDPVTPSAEGVHTVSGAATDGAGNTATDSALVRLDLTKPVITAGVTGPKSAHGWYTDDVTVSYACSDALSGIATCPQATTLAEGANQSASGTATDQAGNTASDGVTGIDVDETAPVLTAAYSTAWHTDDVTVTWTCHDGLSGIIGADDTFIGPDHTWTTTVTGEGKDLSATETCTDAAGNTATTTARGIRIDRHAPTTTASTPDTPASGWFTGPAVDVTLQAGDLLSGVAATTYTIDGGKPQTYTGTFEVTGDGEHTIDFHSADVAGNVEEPPASLDLKIDGTAPTTTVINPISPASDWFVTSGIPFAFDAHDAHSGVAATYFTVDGGDPETYGAGFTRDLSDGTHTVSYWSVDLAGNEEQHRSFGVNVDTAPPSIEGHRSPAPNGFGWSNTDVSVTFSCSDATSGIPSGVAGCAGDTVLTNEGAGQTVTGDAVDNAGNTSHATYGPVNIDRTKPTLTGTASPPNGAGWYDGDVTITWQGDDQLSGIDPTSVPSASTVTGEGRHLTASASISDKAGNTQAASVTDLRIDRTGPTVTGGPTTQPNAAGWYHSSVLVDWSCVDPALADGSAGSGVASCPTSSLLAGDGAGQSVTSGKPKDVAGNTGDPATVSGIDIDGTAPVSTADNQCTKINGWCTGDTASVVLSATDQPGLSGVKEIHYRVDGGAEQVAAGAVATVTVPLSASGAGTVSYWAVDNADNAEIPNSVALEWDNIAPTVSHALTPPANAQGWNHDDVTVTFSAKDDDQGSGVAEVSAPVTVSDETDGRDVTGTASDVAGNIGSDKVRIKLDKTAPTITASVTSGALGDNGWYVGPVTVAFTCGDSLSGVAACPDPVILSGNGANQVTRSVSDRAGNQASATVSGIRIDQEKPTVTSVNLDGGTYVLGTVPQATCTASDTVSGLASCTVAVSGGTANGVGTLTWTARARDNAGNLSTSTGTFHVVYQFDGFLQPINDTAHQVGATTSIFKAGSTVPVKLQLKSSAGTLVQPSLAPEWLTPVMGSGTSAPVDESVYSAAADSGTAYRYDATAQQWIYNWKTSSKGGNYWRIGVTLDDGKTYYTNIGLR